MLRWTARTALIVLTALAGVPIAGALASAIAEGEPWSWSFSASRLVLTACLSVAIGVLSTALAWPVARATRTLSRGWLVLPLLPLLMPTYLIPGAWRTLLDPSSAIGAWLLRRSMGGANLVQIADGVLAALGLSVWASAIAWIILHFRLRSLGAVVDSLWLDCGGAVQREIAMLAVCRSAIVRSVVVVGVVMLAQTVPFDLAQIETISNAVRIEISLGRHREAWLVAAPGLLVAAAAGVWFGAGGVARIERARVDEGGSPGRFVVAVLPLLVGVVLPTALLVGTLRDPAAVGRFLRRSGDAIGSTLGNALVVGGLALVLGLAMSVALRESRRLALACAGAMAMLALVPGVLAGAAVSRSFGLGFVPAWLADSAAPLWTAHLGRFGVVACLAAMWVRACEPRELDDLAALRGPSLRGWLAGDLGRHLAPLLGAAMAVGALSVHEIESAVLLQPVGTDALARFMLELLHYQRRDDLAAGVLLIGSVALGLGAIGAALAGGVLRANPRGAGSLR